jgi:CRP-like cAMP-binding protein
MTNDLVHVPTKASPVLVKQAKLFAELPIKLLETLQQHFQLNEWRKGEYINSSVLTKRFFVILDGQLELKQSNPETGREATVDMLYPGDCFDLVVLLDGQQHDVIIAPLNTVRLISVPIEKMRHWIWTYPELNKKFLPYLAQKMREKEDQATSFVLHDMTTRLSRIILKHITKIKSYTGKRENEHSQHLINGLNDETLARMVGSVRQVVNKQLQHWKAQGILNKKRNQIMINDLAALEKEARYAQDLPHASSLKSLPSR